MTTATAASSARVVEGTGDTGDTSSSATSRASASPVVAPPTRPPSARQLQRRMSMSGAAVPASASAATAAAAAVDVSATSGAVPAVPLPATTTATASVPSTSTTASTSAAISSSLTNTVVPNTSSQPPYRPLVRIQPKPPANIDVAPSASSQTLPHSSVVSGFRAGMTTEMVTTASNCSSHLTRSSGGSPAVNARGTPAAKATAPTSAPPPPPIAIHRAPYFFHRVGASGMSAMSGGGMGNSGMNGMSGNVMPIAVGMNASTAPGHAMMPYVHNGGGTVMRSPYGVAHSQWQRPPGHALASHPSTHALASARPMTMPPPPQVRPDAQNSDTTAISHIDTASYKDVLANTTAATSSTHAYSLTISGGTTPDINNPSGSRTAASSSPTDESEPSVIPFGVFGAVRPSSVGSMSVPGSSMSAPGSSPYGLQRAGGSGACGYRPPQLYYAQHVVSSSVPPSHPPSLMASSSASPAPSVAEQAAAVVPSPLTPASPSSPSPQFNVRLVADQLHLEYAHLHRMYSKGLERLSPRLARLVCEKEEFEAARRGRKMHDSDREERMPLRYATLARARDDPLSALGIVAMLEEARTAIEMELLIKHSPLSIIAMDAITEHSGIGNILIHPLADFAARTLDRMPSRVVVRLYRHFSDKDVPNLSEFACGAWRHFERMRTRPEVVGKVQAVLARRYRRRRGGVGVTIQRRQQQQDESADTEDVDEAMSELSSDDSYGDAYFGEESRGISVDPSDDDAAAADGSNNMDIRRAMRHELYADVDVETYGKLGDPLPWRTDINVHDVTFLRGHVANVASASTSMDDSVLLLHSAKRVRSADDDGDDRLHPSYGGGRAKRRRKSVAAPERLGAVSASEEARPVCPVEQLKHSVRVVGGRLSVHHRRHDSWWLAEQRETGGNAATLGDSDEDEDEERRDGSVPLLRHRTSEQILGDILALLGEEDGAFLTEC